MFAWECYRCKKANEIEGRFELYTETWMVLDKCECGVVLLAQFLMGAKEPSAIVEEALTDD